ncbi:hypothetical protein SDC9_203905 [bioreactor metagenome]|uniref:Uncharacterized protein n=1 Tax=bioreactor metagenome TaxID=1076179 RepID=A0A645J0H7_9ZZZZ
MQVIQRLVAADGVHVGHKALARPESIAAKRIALPFGKRLHHLAVAARCGDIKGNRTFHAVQVVV